MRALPRLPANAGGGDDRDRTDDPLLAKQVLSQLSYAPNLETHPTRKPLGQPDHPTRHHLAANTTGPAHPHCQNGNRIGGPGRI